MAGEAEPAPEGSKNPPAPANPAMKFYGMFEENKEYTAGRPAKDQDKSEKKYYYVLAPQTLSAPQPQFFRTVNPFQLVPAVRPVFASAANPFEPKSSFAIAPMALRPDLKNVGPVPAGQVFLRSDAPALAPAAASVGEISPRSDYKDDAPAPAPQPMERISVSGGSIDMKQITLRSHFAEDIQAQMAPLQPLQPIQSIEPIQPIQPVQQMERLAIPNLNENSPAQPEAAWSPEVANSINPAGIPQAKSNNAEAPVAEAPVAEEPATSAPKEESPKKDESSIAQAKPTGLSLVISSIIYIY